MASSELQPDRKVAGQRHYGHVDGTGEPRGGLGEDPIARTNGHALEPLIHALVLQDTDQGQVGSVLAGPPKVARGREGERDHGGRVMAASDDARGIVEARHDLLQRRDRSLDLVRRGTGAPRDVSMSIKRCRPSLWAVRVFVMPTTIPCTVYVSTLTRTRLQHRLIVHDLRAGREPTVQPGPRSWRNGSRQCIVTGYTL